MTEFGIGTYTRNIVRALGRLDQSNEYVLIGPPDKVAEIGEGRAEAHLDCLSVDPENYILYFDFDKSELSSQARLVIDQSQIITLA